VNGIRGHVVGRDLDLAPVVLAGAGAALGAAFVVVAWAVHPLLVPGVLALAVLVAATLREPAVGVAAGFLLVPLSNLGVLGQPPWALTTAWGAFLCLLGLWRRRAGEPLPAFTLAIAAFLVVAIVSFVLGGASANGHPELRSLGTGLLYFTGIALLVRTPRQRMWALGGIAAAVALVGGVAAYERVTGAVTAQAFFTPDGALVGRVAAGFGHPNELGGFLVVLMPFVLAGAIVARRGRWAFVAAAALGTYGVYASFSRGALVGLVLVPFFFLRGRRVLVLAPTLALLLALTAPGLVGERFATLTQSGSEVATRVDFWRTAAEIWQQNPVLGAGLGQFPQAYAESRLPGRGFLPGTLSEPPPHAHNLLLQTAATEGLAGLVVLLAILAAAVSVALRLRRSDDRSTAVFGSASVAFLAAFLIHNQFDVTLLEGTGIYVWALLGLVAGAWTPGRRNGTAT
jgi:O-antigen ligase